jgi:hypothetical protein
LEWPNDRMHTPARASPRESAEMPLTWCWWLISRALPLYQYHNTPDSYDLSDGITIRDHYPNPKKLTRIVHFPEASGTNSQLLNFDTIGPRLQFVLVNILDLLRLNAKVIKGLPLRTMVESYHQPWNVHLERDSLVFGGKTQL